MDDLKYLTDTSEQNKSLNVFIFFPVPFIEIIPDEINKQQKLTLCNAGCRKEKWTPVDAGKPK